MPTIVGILAFMSKTNFSLSGVEHEKCFITFWPSVRCTWIEEKLKICEVNFFNLINSGEKSEHGKI